MHTRRHGAAACTVALAVTAGLAVSALAGCAAPDTPGDHEVACRDRTVTVHHAPGYLAAHPEHLEICAGRTVVVSLEPPVEAGAARTEPAGERRPPWLGNANRTRDRIEIRVPADADYGTYKYSIAIDDVGTLDPRLTVSRR